ncbi:MAG: hypothetical protein ACI9KS_001548 [Sulfitobacter sp.]|jgi:hypothetical protein
MIGFLFKFFGLVVLLGGIGLVGYAYLVDLAPPQTEFVQQIEVSVD